jgi:hypothetical protein
VIFFATEAIAWRTLIGSSITESAIAASCTPTVDVQLRSSTDRNRQGSLVQDHAGAAVHVHGIYNRKYHKVGHLFQGRYKAILCDREAYLLELVRYLHLNPGRIRSPMDPWKYLWSSMRHT